MVGLFLVVFAEPVGRKTREQLRNVLVSERAVKTESTWHVRLTGVGFIVLSAFALFHGQST